MRSEPLPPRVRRARASAVLLALILFRAPAGAQTPGQPPPPPQTPQGMGVSTGSGLVSATRCTAGIVDPKAPPVFEDVTVRTALAQFRHVAGSRQKE